LTRKYESVTVLSSDVDQLNEENRILKKLKVQNLDESLKQKNVMTIVYLVVIILLGYEIVNIL